MLVIANKFQMLDFLSNNLYQDMIYIVRIWKWRMIPDFPTGINEFLIIHSVIEMWVGKKKSDSYVH